MLGLGSGGVMRRQVIGMVAQAGRLGGIHEGVQMTQIVVGGAGRRVRAQEWPMAGCRDAVDTSSALTALGVGAIWGTTRLKPPYCHNFGQNTQTICVSVDPGSTFEGQLNSFVYLCGAGGARPPNSFCFFVRWPAARAHATTIQEYKRKYVPRAKIDYP